jgi:hypothetical protein
MNNPIFENVEPTAETSEVSAVNIASGEVLVGSLAAFDDQGRPLVSHPLMSTATPIPAITTQGLSHQHLGRQVALMFVNGQLNQPIIVGLIHSPLYALLENITVAASTENIDNDVVVFESPLPKKEKRDSSQTLQIDGKRVVIEGQEEITLSCGEASITLTKAGKILIRGTYLQSRATGVNRILGGSVQVN